MQNLAFFFSFVDEDFHLAERLVSQIQSFYPDSLVLAMGDGASRTNNLECVSWHGEHLKRQGTIGMFIQRNFRFILDMLDSDSKIDSIIKLDPDSFLKRPFANIPEDLWCGESNQGSFSWGNSIWCKGGGYLIKKEAIEKIVKSELLLDKKYTELQGFEKSGNRIYEDCRLGHVANSLGIFPTEWSEVSCGKISKFDKRYRKKALVHPVKQIN